MAKTSRPPSRRRLRDQILLLEVMASLGAGHITENYIIDEDEPSARTHGICEGNGHVTVNPALDIVDTVIHELLHRVRPQWTERAVRIATARIMGSLTHDEIILIDQLYHSVKRTRKRK